MSAIIIVPSIMPDKQQLVSFVTGNIHLVSVLLFLISLIGLGVFMYILNLRLDAILYARAVNGIRKHFYDESTIDIDRKLRMRTLPQSPHLPHYLEGSFFLPVVIVFTILNTLYAWLSYYVISSEIFTNLHIDTIIVLLLLLILVALAINIFFFSIHSVSGVFIAILIITVVGAFYIYKTYYTWDFAMFEILLFNVLSIAISVIFFVLHIELYRWYAYHRETEYLRSNIIGIDIDGVLNKHRYQFCKILSEIFPDKIIDPNDILIYPVHEYAKLDLAEDDAKKVFNKAEYWTEMPVREDAKKYIDKIRNIFKLKTYIFTYRPWPDMIKNNKDRLVEDIANFIAKCKHFYFDNFILSILLKLPIPSKILCYYKELPLKRIAKEWLDDRGIKYDKFILERGGDSTTDPRGEFRNRFRIGKDYKIKYFVEDDLEKAVKLSYICDVVFLYAHPYNKYDERLLPEYGEINEFRKNYPSNIIPVNSWFDIYKHIRRLS
jgi:hypothetical protein